MVALPQYQLFSQANVDNEPNRWRFVLRPLCGGAPLEAGDVEPDICGERLELLSVVRGLEALDHPSRVTLVTSSIYVREGIRYGLEEWRRNDWQWESFGQMVPVKHQDLWRRIDHALQFHEVECRTWRFDAAHAGVPAGHVVFGSQSPASVGEDRTEVWSGIRPRLQRLIALSRERITSGIKELQRVACM